ncbi:BCCT family transporter [Halococcus saccharolyticus]|uniref:Glycine betaine transporter BetL n=1 Tax=Halococcus saccharolyticus DSM 5350 TaxID=1227455 RepID=M0MQB1_9EURY|nr:BCCT family transporter [Halococcus saccharolyticus]EMA47917.1 glycine betaine transporter BetL [Halococcus saccharolyticus DSM 5350]
MSTQGAGPVETVLRSVLVPICVIAGAVVVSVFFFPGVVGSLLTGGAILIVSLLFFGSGLAYVALLPITVDVDAEKARRDAPYLLRIRRLGWVGTIKGAAARFRNFLARQDPLTFGVPVAAFVLFFAAYYLAPSGTQSVVGTVESVLLHEFGWLFLGAMFLAVCYCLVLLVGPWGDIKLGGPDAEPTYTYPTYFAMFFTAGIAAGIVFWGPAEALFHYDTPPPFLDAQPRSGGVVAGALTYAIFHYGFSAWSAYVVIGVPIAYFTYQRGAPLRVSSILTPFLGVDGLDSRWATLVDVLAVFATIGGIATSVALVGQQFLAGVSYQWGVTYGGVAPVLVVAGLTLIYVVSAQSGVHRGIRRIAGVAIVLFVLFAALLIAVGPQSAILDIGSAAVGGYVVDFVPMSLYLGGGLVAEEWVANWTVWNWSWWFSWAPFAGLFLAALSKGRRVRTVVLTGAVATSAATAVWFVLLGGTSLSLQRSGTADILAAIEAYATPEAVAGFPIFAALPLGQLLMFLFLALIIVFIVTSADTSTLVVAILATKQDRAPTTGSIVFWGLFQGVVAVAVLLGGGGEALQALAVLTGGPFAVLVVVALVGLTLTFRRHERGHRSPLGKLRATVRDHGIAGPSEVLRDDD